MQRGKRTALAAAALALPLIASAQSQFDKLTTYTIGVTIGDRLAAVTYVTVVPSQKDRMLASLNAACINTGQFFKDWMYLHPTPMAANPMIYGFRQAVSEGTPVTGGGALSGYDLAYSQSGRRTQAEMYATFMAVCYDTNAQEYASVP